jgi:phenylalanyl-tRNA synthetase alpha subunit
LAFGLGVERLLMIKYGVEDIFLLKITLAELFLDEEV